MGVEDEWSNLKIGECEEIQVPGGDKYHSYSSYVQRVPGGYLVTNSFTYDPYSGTGGAGVSSVFIPIATS